MHSFYRAFILFHIYSWIIHCTVRKSVSQSMMDLISILADYIHSGSSTAHYKKAIRCLKVCVVRCNHWQTLGTITMCVVYRAYGKDV